MEIMEQLLAIQNEAWSNAEKDLAKAKQILDELFSKYKLTNEDNE
jgi:hypothetical protein